MLTNEQAYLYVVEAGSFKKAAEHVNLEPSSLSRKIAALEERLHIKLLYRSTSKTQPTEAGLAYYEGLRRIIDEQMMLEEEITGGATTLRGKLRIGSTVDLGDKFIAPVINSLRNEAPELAFELFLDSEMVDLAQKNLDVAIRIGPMPNSGLFAKRIGEIPRVLVASPDYLEAQGIPNYPSDLAAHQFVLYSPSQAKADLEFVDGTRFPHSSISSKICVNSLRTIRYLVRKGAGIHWGPQWLYQEDLDNGKLINVLPHHPVEGFSVYAVYSARAFMPQKTRLFIQRLSEKFMEVMG